jgi:predicted O-methyltransferase YrrM
MVPQVAQENITNAGLATKVEVIVGDAVDSLAKIEPEAPFDLVFIDADKTSNLQYFREAKRLVRKGGVIVRGFINVLDGTHSQKLLDCRQRCSLRKGRGPILFRRQR